MAASGLFHIMGHADLIKKFGFRPSGDLRPYYEPSLEAMKESGACLELNTAGWRNKCAEQYPDAQFLKMAAEMNIPLTISSDAHKPDECLIRIIIKEYSYFSYFPGWSFFIDNLLFYNLFRCFLYRF